MQDQKLKLSLVQYDIVWEDKVQNLNSVESFISVLAGETDIIVLPEMSFTAFTLNTHVAETEGSELMNRIKDCARTNEVAICGSLLYKENDKFYNRAFFISPEESHFYNKRHLFRMGREGEVITAGNSKLIFEYKGFKICLLVCYDLRFPVWTRNRYNEYDLAIYVGNWPKPRIKVWDTLLKARAIENMSYVCGVNRVGLDDTQMTYPGLSMVVNQRGEIIEMLPENETACKTVELSKQVLLNDRNRFPVWKDADKFSIEY